MDFAKKASKLLNVKVVLLCFMENQSFQQKLTYVLPIGGWAVANELLNFGPNLRLRP